MKLTDVAYLVGSGLWGFGLSDDLDCHVYLIDGGEELALVDAGAGRAPERIVANILADGLPLDRLRYLLLTHGHADHAGGAAWLREQFDLQVLISSDIADAIRQGDERAISLEAAREVGGYPHDYHFRPCPVDRELHDGDRIQVGRLEVAVLDTPGHSLGSVSFVTHAGDRAYLFSGDSLFFGGKLALQDIPDCDLRASLDTIRKLGGLSVDVFLPGHLCISLSSGQRHVEAALGFMSKLGVPPSIT